MDFFKLTPLWISGAQDKALLIRAFNETRVGNYEFNVAAGLDWILSLDSHQQKQSFSDYGMAESPVAKVVDHPT